MSRCSSGSRPGESAHAGTLCAYNRSGTASDHIQYRGRPGMAQVGQMLQFCSSNSHDIPCLNTTADEALFAPNLPAHYQGGSTTAGKPWADAQVSAQRPRKHPWQTHCEQCHTDDHKSTHKVTSNNTCTGALLRMLRRSRKTVCECMDMAYVPLPTGSALITCHPARPGHPPDQAAQTAFAGRTPGHPGRRPSSQLLGRRAERRAFAQD